MEYHVTTFYIFTPLTKEELPTIKKSLEEKAAELGVQGLLLLAEEGANATLSGSEKDLEAYKQFLCDRFGALKFKDSVSEKPPFRRFKVKIKQEIVQLKRTDIQPTGQEPHVSAEEWDRLVEDEDAVLIDVRNWYEVKLGTFKNAIDPKTWTFSQFPKWVKKSDIPKEKKVGIFCTGGIRCEKAAVAMKELGYENVYQLDGGILDYIDKRPNQNFEGDCFVFDHRTAVGQDLRPSKTLDRCWSCGNAGSIDRTCELCNTEYKACEDCAQSMAVALCSKNCRHHYNMRKETQAA